MARWSSFVRTSAIGTWCDRHVPSTGLPSTSFGPVQPLGVLNTIIGHRGRSVTPPSRAAFWIAWISSITVSIVAASCWWTLAGSSPSTKYGLWP